MVRLTRPAAAAVALAAALACAAWPSGTSPALAATRLRAASSAPPPSGPACYNFAVGALRRHVVVQRMPPACAGLGPQEVNEAVARAVRTVVGPQHKAAARRLAAADSRYLGSLVRPVGPAPPASAIAAPGVTSPTVAARLAALTAWLAAVIAGAWLLASRLGMRGRRGRAAGGPGGIAGSHAGLATAGLGLWIAFTVTGSPLIGWLDVALTWLIAGLGMATLLAEPHRSYAHTNGSAMARANAIASAPATGTSTTISLTPARGQAPVMTIALHGALAVITMVLVLLAVLSVG